MKNKEISPKIKEILLELVELIWETFDDDEFEIIVSVEKWWNLKNKIKELE